MCGLQSQQFKLEYRRLSLASTLTSWKQRSLRQLRDGQRSSESLGRLPSVSEGLDEGDDGAATAQAARHGSRATTVAAAADAQPAASAAAAAGNANERSLDPRSMEAKMRPREEKIQPRAQGK